jgi:hypothetical protein
MSDCGTQRSNAAVSYRAIRSGPVDGQARRAKRLSRQSAVLTARRRESLIPCEGNIFAAFSVSHARSRFRRGPATCSTSAVFPKTKRWLAPDTRVGLRAADFAPSLDWQGIGETGTVAALHRHPPPQRLSDSSVLHVRSAGISWKVSLVQVERIMLGYLINVGKDFMLPHLICWTGMLLERAEHSRRDAYLGSCADIGELERRMRACDGDA